MHVRALQVVGKSFRDHITTICLASLLAAFAISASLLALRLGPVVVPDEPTHYAVSKLFSTTWWIPPNTFENMRFGPVHNSPFLFYWMNGRLLNLLDWLAPSMPDRSLLVAFRLLGVAYSAVAILFAYLGAGEILKDRGAQLVVVFLLTGTSMYVLISAGDSYDNLANLCSFAAFYFLMRVFNGRPFWQNSLIWLTIIAAGTLVKITVLPLAGIMGLLWLVYVFKRRREIDFRLTRDAKMISLALLAAAAVVISAGFYCRNLIRYGNLLPNCTQVLQKKECYIYPQYERDQKLMLPVKVSLPEILRGAYPDPVGYAMDFWSPWMIAGVYGLITHQGFFRPEPIVIDAYRLLMIAIVLVTIRYWQKPSYAVAALYVIAVGYGLVLLSDGYNSERLYGFLHVGIQGRYIFPVLGPLYICAVYAMDQIPGRILRGVMFGVTVALFIVNSPLGFFLRFWGQLGSKLFS